MKIACYTIIKKIYSSSNSIIYLASRNTDNSKIVIKMLPKEYPTQSENAKFLLEYENARSFNCDEIIKMYDIEKYMHTYIIIMEYFDGVSLSNLINTRKIELPEFLEIALKLVNAIGEIHKKNIIHKDINPSNILWNSENKILKIIDFGISSKLSHETQSVIDPNGLEGTIPYFSPEQSGRMNRSIDYRSDYYSLGVTLYELITGRKPFEATDILEIIHSHLARFPISPFEMNPEIPKPISDIIMKLLSKNAEGRPQSSFGIRYDLDKCLNNLNELGYVKDFEIGTINISERFEIPQKLYGRENELTALINGFELVCNSGYTEMLIVTGVSGIGKSALIQELNKSIFVKRGYFISGKCEQYSGNIPYMPIIQALQDFVKQILSENKEQLNKWKENILSAIGNIGQVIINVIPQLEKITGKQPELAQLEPIRENNRFNIVFQNFIKSLASKEHPLVFFIDDLQWSDVPTLKLIEMFMTNNEIKYIYFTGAYRENEVNETHTLSITLNEINKKSNNINKIKLAPLNFENICNLIINTLKCDTNDVVLLSNICIEKTQGNPFYINQFLKSLYEKNLITLDNKKGKWICDIEKIKDMGITENVVDFMSKKILNLSNKTQNVLKLAACYGNKFDLETLIIVTEKSKSNLADELWEALNEGLILPIDNNYRLVFTDDEETNATYKFLHDKVQQASYSLIDDELKKTTHLKIGRLILSNATKNNLEEKLFEIINHINVGLDLITDSSEKQTLAAVYLKACKKARSSSAYDMAYNYIQTGLRLLDDKTLYNQNSIYLEYYTEAAEVAYLNGMYDEMDILLEKANKITLTIFDKISLIKVEIRALIAQDKRNDAVNKGLLALKLLGININRKPGKLNILLYVFKIKLLLARKKYKDFLDMPQMTDKNKLEIMSILSLISSSAYHIDVKLFLIIGLEITLLSIKYGNEPFSIIGYCTYALFYFVMEKIKIGLKYTEMCMNLFEKIGQDNMKSLFLFSLATFLIHHKIDINSVFKIYDEAYLKGIETGDLEFSGQSMVYKLRFGFFSGKSLLELDKEADFCYEILNKINLKTCIPNYKITHQMITNLLNPVSSPYLIEGNIITNEYNLLQSILLVNSKPNIFAFYFSKLVLNILFNQKTAIEELTIKCRKYLVAIPSTIMVSIFYFYDSLAQFIIFDNYSEKTQKKTLKKILKVVKSNQKKIKLRMTDVPTHNLHKYFLIKAEIARITRHESIAIKYYKKSIDLAAKNEYINEEAIACERAGLFYKSMKDETVAYIYFSKARFCFERWGAITKVSDMDKNYPELKNYLSNSNNMYNNSLIKTTESISITSMNTSQILDLTSVVKASQAISSEMEYSSLIDKLIRVITENAGAQKIILLNKHDDNYEIEALYNLEDDKLVFIKENDFTGKLPYGIINFVDRTGEIFVQDNSKISQFSNDEYIKIYNPKSLLCIPLIHKGEIRRILYMENSLTAGAFTPERVKILNMLSSQMVISIENAVLYQQAVTDGLTRIYNRTFFDNYFIKRTNEAKRYGSELSLLILDIDHFKNFNDKYGHQTGDLVLNQVATTIKNSIRDSDLAARYGGEEFVVVLPKTGTEGALVLAEKIRRSIEELQVEYLHNKELILLKVTVSIGVTEFSNIDNRISIIERADKNLYLAKQEGRNKIKIDV